MVTLTLLLVILFEASTLESANVVQVLEETTTEALPEVFETAFEPKYVVVVEGWDVFAELEAPIVLLEDGIGFSSLICLIKYAFSSLNCSSSERSVWKRERKSTNFSWFLSRISNIGLGLLGFATKTWNNAQISRDKCNNGNEQKSSWKSLIPSVCWLVEFKRIKIYWVCWRSNWNILNFLFHLLLSR